MVKRIVWSSRAEHNLKDILDYWNTRNKSKSYSRKLSNLIFEAIEIIQKYPDSGKPSNIANIRFRIVRDYYVIYEKSHDQISILAIWDTRQNPVKLKRILRGK